MSVNTEKLTTGITYIEAQVMLLEAYDADYGLDTGSYNVEMCEEECLLKGSLWEYWARAYITNRIWDTWHVSLDDFLKRPRAEMQKMCSIAGEEEVKALADLSNVQNLLEQKGVSK